MSSSIDLSLTDELRKFIDQNKGAAMKIAGMTCINGSFIDVDFTLMIQG